MGQFIQKTSFSEKDFLAFQDKLHQCLEALELVLERPVLGWESPPSARSLSYICWMAKGVPCSKTRPFKTPMTTQR